MSENPFKVGDLVRGMDVAATGLIYNHIYRVVGIGRFSISVDDPNGNGWYASRFELVYRPGKPETWKPKPGDPVRFGGDGTYYDTTKVHHVIEEPDGEFVADAVWVDYGVGRGWNYAPTWITWEDSLLVPMTHAEASTFVAPAKGEEPKTEAETSESPEISDLKAEIEAMREESRLQQERAARAEKALQDFREQVRNAVIREAKARHWCSEADEWLEELGLEPRWTNHDLPTCLGAVVKLAGGRFAVLEGDDYRSTPWRSYPSCEWIAYSEVYEDLDEVLSEGFGDDISDE